MSAVLHETSIPGFVDLQVNGFRGHDFASLSLTFDGVCEVCEELLASGTAGFLATMVTSSEEIYRRNLPILAEAVRDRDRCRNLLGVHLEGPFISDVPGYVGAHDPADVRPPDEGFLKALWDWSDGAVRLLTIAAEAEGSDRLAKRACEMGMKVSIGHSSCSEKDLRRLVQAGAVALTHLGNAVPNLLPRHPNPIWNGLGNDDLAAMVIGDGHHLPDSVIKAVFAVKGVSKTIVVSDVSPMGGLDPGVYSFAGSPVELEPSGAIRNVRKDCLAGSAMTMLPAMNRLAGAGFLSLDELLHLGFWNPMALIGLAPQELPRDTALLFDPESHRFSIRLDK